MHKLLRKNFPIHHYHEKYFLLTTLCKQVYVLMLTHCDTYGYFSEDRVLLFFVLEEEIFQRGKERVCVYTDIRIHVCKYMYTDMYIRSRKEHIDYIGVVYSF